MTNKPELDAAKLRELVDVIEAGKHRFLDLCARLQAEDGMKLTKVRGGAGGSTCRMAGITATCTGGDHCAVMNWSNAARRKLLELELEAEPQAEEA